MGAYILLLLCGSFAYTMNQEKVDQEKNDTWTIKRYFGNKKLTRWGKTTQEQAEKYVLEGQKIWDTLVQDDYPKNKISFDQKEELIKRVAVCWYLYSKALDQKKPFYNGMFIIKDTPSHHIYDFFYTYVENTIDENHKYPVYYSKNLFSYARHSTHFTRYKQKNSEYGIDVRYSKREWSSYDLPSGCTHILFGKLKNDDNKACRMFLKMEDAGLYFAELPYHINGVVGSCMRKMLPCIFGFNIASKMITLNNGEFCQKEHLPHEISDLYYKCCKDNNVVPLCVGTIGHIWSHCHSFEDNDNPLQSIIDYLNNRYTDLQGRFGNEIIIDGSTDS